MSKNSQMPIGDLSGRETELGVSMPEMVEQRAREIARLDERIPDQYTDADWEQARKSRKGSGRKHGFPGATSLRGSGR